MTPTAHDKPGRLRPGFCLSACAAFLALSFAAAAQVTATSDYLARMDADRDGRIALVEYQDWLSYAFNAMDKNRDGVLMSSELPGGRGKPVTRAEHRAKLAATFLRQDANRNGSLSAKELAAPPQ